MDKWSVGIGVVLNRCQYRRKEWARNIVYKSLAVNRSMTFRIRSGPNLRWYADLNVSYWRVFFYRWSVWEIVTVGIGLEVWCSLGFIEEIVKSFQKEHSLHVETYFIWTTVGNTRKMFKRCGKLNRFSSNRYLCRLLCLWMNSLVSRNFSYMQHISAIDDNAKPNQTYEWICVGKRSALHFHSNRLIIR